MTFGTVLGYMSIASRVYRAALRAVEHVEARVLLTVGNRFDPGALGPLPSHVHVEPWVDQDRVFPEADLVVCHGGSGTAFGALAAGVPLVTVPVFAGCSPARSPAGPAATWPAASDCLECVLALIGRFLAVSGQRPSPGRY